MDNEGFNAGNLRIGANGIKYQGSNYQTVEDMQRDLVGGKKFPDLSSAFSQIQSDLEGANNQWSDEDE